MSASASPSAAADRRASVASGDFPRRPGELTTDWLRTVLRDAGALADGDLASTEVSPTAVGFGAVGAYARVRLSYARPTRAPGSLFAKFSSDKPSVRAHAHARGLYARDVRFYREVASLVAVRTPRCYFADVDMPSGHSLLLLEDLTDGRGGDVLAGCTLAEAELLLRMIATLHARWWNSPQLPSWRWLPGYDTEPNLATDDYLAAWPRFRERYAALIPGWAVETAERALACVPEIRALLGAGPPTFTHGDLGLDNARFDLGDAPVVLFDWQISMRAPGARDVSWFLVRSLPVEQRRAQEAHLLRIYHEALVSQGVRGYSLESLWRHVQLGVLLALPLVISAGVNIDFSSERGKRVIEARIVRNIAMIEDHDVWDSLG
jgi:hypothetical protein